MIPGRRECDDPGPSSSFNFMDYSFFLHTFLKVYVRLPGGMGDSLLAGRTVRIGCLFDSSIAN